LAAAMACQSQRICCCVYSSEGSCHERRSPVCAAPVQERPSPPPCEEQRGGGGCNVRALRNSASCACVAEKNTLLHSKQLGTAKGGHAVRNRDQAWHTWPWHDLSLAWTATSSCWLLAFLHCSCLALAVLHGQNCSVNAHVLSTQKRVLAVQERYALSVPSQQQGGGGFPRVTRIPGRAFSPLRISLTSLGKIFDHGPHQCWRAGSLARPRGQGKWQRGTKVGLL
jgi:hypothetical protein